jgi:hypothetical protein
MMLHILHCPYCHGTDMAAFNVLVQWRGFQPHASGFVSLSIAEFHLENTTIVAWCVRDSHHGLGGDHGESLLVGYLAGDRAWPS